MKQKLEAGIDRPASFIAIRAPGGVFRAGAIAKPDHRHDARGHPVRCQVLADSQEAWRDGGPFSVRLFRRSKTNFILPGERVDFEKIEDRVKL